MRKIIILLALFIPITVLAQSKILIDPDFETLMVALDDEEFTTAFNMATKLLDKSSSNDEAVPLIRYLYLEAALGKTSKGAMSYQTLKEKMNRIVGKELSTKPRLVVSNCTDRVFNPICKGDEPNTLFSSLSNPDGTTIYLFEQYKNVSDDKFQLILGKEIVLSGFLESFELNPRESGVWIMRVTFNDVGANFPP